MLKYLIVPLSSHSTSFCHYNIVRNDRGSAFITPEVLSEIIIWAIKENLSIQFIYSDDCVPKELESIINSIDHIDIVPETSVDNQLLINADIIVSEDLNHREIIPNKIYIVRLKFSDLVKSIESLKDLLKQSIKVNVIITDINNLTKEIENQYHSFLTLMSEFISTEATNNRILQLNLITDRILLSSMNNCNAGDECVAVSLDGSLYPCPAFIGNKDFKCGDIRTGFDAPNLRLYKISNAPICKICDAYQCKRCIWLNDLFTHEVNTPGKEQCVIAHIERTASSHLIDLLRENGRLSLDVEIKKLDYLDPFESLYKNECQ